MSICLIFGGLFSFSGCSIYTKDSTKANSVVVMKIGDTDVTKEDLLSAFYTYYQNNSTYFAYYSEETIEESFYTWFTVKTLVTELSKKALYNATTNTKGYIYYTNEDADEVWGYVEEYFYSQVSAYEKAIYQASGVSEDDYPEWLQSEEDEEEETKFEHYTSSTKDIEEDILKDRYLDKADKLTDKEVYDKVAALISNLFKYEVGEDETKKDIGEKGDDAYNKRNQAYTRYIEALKLSAKSNGDNSSTQDLIKAEVLRVYNAYYDSQISVIYQNYYMKEYLLNKDDAGDKTSLSDRAVVAKFLDKYYLDKQVNSFYNPYVSTMESEDGASLVLYHYQGNYYYFSVQHILLAFDDNLSEKVGEIEGNGSSEEFDGGNYVDERNQCAEDNKLGILVEIDEAREKNTIKTYANYYYYDEDRKDIYDATAEGSDAKIYNGYVQLTTMNVDGSYSWKAYTNSLGEEISTTEGAKEGVVGVKKMANSQDVLDAFSANFDIWMEKAKQVCETSLSSMDAEIDSICSANDGELEDLRYVLEVAKNYKETGLCSSSDYTAFEKKIASLLFLELEWLYSGDSLGNEISNKIGYICSSFDDNNTNWVVEFADGAREILNNMINGEGGFSALSSKEKALYTESYVTDYGIHIIKVENVYDSEHSSVIDLASVSADYSLTEDSAFVQEVAALLKKTYVCTSSNETLYDYFRDEVYTALAGSSSSSGSYFLGLEYAWLAEYYNDSKVETYEKIGYDELVASLS